ncbi:hypothetical protein ACEQ8H_004088 [Pleosporales sp. CAS-2024a]
MFYPPPLGGAPSINNQSTTLDAEFNFPLGCCGPDGGDSLPGPGLCRGHLDKFDTEEPSVTWTPGQDAHFQLTDYSYDPDAPGGTHYGGSCQVGFSVDKGATWKVAASYHGACPKHTEDGSPEAQTFDFKVPTGMPPGDALFAWVWLNREHESFVNCAKVSIAGGSGTYPAVPSNKPAASSTPPLQSYGAQPKPPQISTQPRQPDGDEPTLSAKPPHASVTDRRGSGAVTTIYKTVTKTVGSEPTPSPDDDEDDQDSDDSKSDDADSEDSEEAKRSWHHRPHGPVKPNARRYLVEGWKCECVREPLRSRCYCDSSDKSRAKRAEIEKQALRMHRRALYKRIDACDWASAPPMQVSYYTIDAKCAPNAKKHTPDSDTFELGWDVSCGVVEGDGQYQIKTMECDMFGA